jgi:hypothetical protein
VGAAVNWEVASKTVSSSRYSWLMAAPRVGSRSLSKRDVGGAAWDAGSGSVWRDVESSTASGSARVGLAYAWQRLASFCIQGPLRARRPVPDTPPLPARRGWCRSRVRGHCGILRLEGERQIGESRGHGDDEKLIAVEGCGGEQVCDALSLRVGRLEVHRWHGLPTQGGQLWLRVAEEFEIGDDCFPTAAGSQQPHTAYLQVAPDGQVDLVEAEQRGHAHTALTSSPPRMDATAPGRRPSLHLPRRADGDVEPVQ